MGWGRLEEELRALIAREGLGERVRIVAAGAARSEVVAAAAGASVGVIPYEPVGLNNTYTTPNKLFDYMAAGLPVVASRLPELVRFVEGGGMGLTFAPGDPASLAARAERDPRRPGALRGACASAPTRPPAATPGSARAASSWRSTRGFRYVCGILWVRPRH